MMRMNNVKMLTKVPRLKLLETLKSNLAKHSSIVQEARDGYIKKAKLALESRLEQLRKGQLVTLQFTLSPPVDYSEVYKSAIAMLEWNENQFVELQADEFRQLVQDEWDWTDGFLASNSAYSRQSWNWLQEKTGGSLVAPPPE